MLPTLDMWDAMHGTGAAVGFHLYLMAQPPGLPERMIHAAADVFFGHFLDIWTRDPRAIPDEIRAAYLAASRAAVPSIVADYRASAGIDVEHDRADRVLPEPAAGCLWPFSSRTGRGSRLRRRRAVARLGAPPHLRHTTVSCGHFMAEEAPADVVKAIKDLVAGH